MDKTLTKKSPIKITTDNSEVILLVSTSKGGFIYYSDEKRRFWEVNGPHLLGSIVHHMVLDPRDNRTILMAAQTREHGPMIFKSIDFGMNWIPAKLGPKFSCKLNIAHIYCICPGHKNEPDTWYAGTSPQGLFRSVDNGDTWHEVSGFNSYIVSNNYFSNSTKAILKYQKINSIMVSPQNSNSLLIGMATGGVFRSLDSGESWSRLNNGIFTNNHGCLEGVDPHLVVQHPIDSNYVYQQNQAGIFRLDKNDKWLHIGSGIDIGDIGFSLCINPHNPLALWVFPMEGTDIWSRVCSGGQPAVYSTQDAGKSWFRQDIGFPMWHAWFTVLNKAMIADHFNSVGVYVGTTSGSIWHSDNEGNSWRQIINNLPKIYALEIGYGNND